MEILHHSVRLDKDKCMGCTNCIKHCPTEAIRVIDGKARIQDDRCIDCGECIRVCPHFAKYAVTDAIDSINRYRYRIALPAPSLYGQFKEAQSAQSILAAMRAIGFDSVFDVARGADIVSAATRAYINSDVPKPVISSACPAILRLLRVRFPNLLNNILPINAPIEVAAKVAREEFCTLRSADPKDVGVFFITPCPAKMTVVQNPMGIEKSEISGCISMIDIFALLVPHIKGKQKTDAANITTASDYGIGWAVAGGEALALNTEKYLAVDGVQNVIQVLEEIENEKFPDLVFFEGLACTGGCVGGPLVFENKYVAKDRIRRLSEKNRNTKEWAQMVEKYAARDELLCYTRPVEPVDIMKLDDDLAVAMQKKEQLEKILLDLPGLDCGSCGSPTCRALAEDVVRGYKTEMDCIFKLRDKLRSMAGELVKMASGDQAQRENKGENKQ